MTALALAPPGVRRFWAVTAAAGGLFYLIVEVPAADPAPRTDVGRPIREMKCLVFRLRVDADGQVADLTPLPEDLPPPGAAAQEVAVTPDGSVLAYTTAKDGLPRWNLTATVHTSGGPRRSHTDTNRSAVHVVDTGTAANWVTDSQQVAAYEGELRNGICPLISADGFATYLSVPQPIQPAVRTGTG